jgi:signal transduction histidine kinase
MKRPLLALSRPYQAALQKHLQPGTKSRVLTARRLGDEAVTLGLETLDLARIHETAVAALMPSGSSSAQCVRMVKKAEDFFTEAIIPIERTRLAGTQSTSRPNGGKGTAMQDTIELTATNRRLKQGLAEHKTVEKAFKKSGRRNEKVLQEAQRLQKHLQHLAHQLLSAQEAQRKKFSHELRDGVAQTLLGVNVQLLTLKKAAKGSAAELTKEIARTQRVVKQSARSIDRFAHQLESRPQYDCDSAGALSEVAGCGRCNRHEEEIQAGAPVGKERPHGS